MPLAQGTAHRFADYVEHTDPMNVDAHRDDMLCGFVAWALVHDPNALTEAFSFETMMSAQGFNIVKMCYVQTVIAAAPHLVKAYEHERQAQPPHDRPAA
jgi:hypothetical protein